MERSIFTFDQGKGMLLLAQPTHTRFPMWFVALPAPTTNPPVAKKKLEYHAGSLWWAHQPCPQPALNRPQGHWLERGKWKMRSWGRFDRKCIQEDGRQSSAPAKPTSFFLPKASAWAAPVLGRNPCKTLRKIQLCRTVILHLSLTSQKTSWFLWPFSWNLEKVDSSVNYLFLLVEGASQPDPSDLQILFLFQLLENKVPSRLAFTALYRHTPELWNNSI